MSKKIIFIFLCAAVVLSAVAASIWCGRDRKERGPEQIGGQQDEHGCLIPAGYSWCPSKQKCLRVWEELCVDGVSDWDVYRNEQYGFELKFPPTWNGYLVSASDYPAYSYAGFSFKGENRQPFMIFQINRYNKEQWEALPENPPFKILDQTADSTLVCDGCCWADSDFTGGGQFDEFQAQRCREAPEILKTFNAL